MCLVSFSGLDGAGKSTQIDRLLATLKAQGRNPVYLWTRGGYTPLFSGLKSLLRSASRGRILPAPGPSRQRTQALAKPAARRTWLVLALLDLLWVFGVQVRWWNRRGRPVICDRYLWDTWIDFCLNFPGESVEEWRLWRILARIAPRPDVAFLLLLPVDESVRRSQLKGEPFPSSREILSSRLALYEQLLAGRGPERKVAWHALDARRPVDDLAAEIGTAVAPLLARSGAATA